MVFFFVFNFCKNIVKLDEWSINSETIFEMPSGNRKLSNAMGLWLFQFQSGSRYYFRGKAADCLSSPWGASSQFLAQPERTNCCSIFSLVNWLAHTSELNSQCNYYLAESSIIAYNSFRFQWHNTAYSFRHWHWRSWRASLATPHDFLASFNQAVPTFRARRV